MAGNKNILTEAFETGFDRLKDIFSNDTRHFNIQDPQLGVKPYKEILRASSPEELNLKKREYFQQLYIEKQYNKIAKDNELKNIQYQSLRLPAYTDYLLMDGYPVISQALTVLAEEATTTGENGKMLNVYSENKKIKKELEHLFYDVLDVNSTLFYWCREMCKQGNTMLYLLTDREKGILGVKMLPYIEMELKEEINETENSHKIKYLWREKNEEFGNWQIAHFRIISDERTLPYGQSVLFPVRQIWRMLRMSEDAMMVYRATRASEKRVVKVNVGNADPTDVPMLMQQAANMFKKSSLIDPVTGQINYKFNPATVEQDIFVAVRNDNAGNPIDTLGGASNLDAIEDIEYLSNLLFTGLGVPKYFLAYSTDGGNEQKGNLSQLDIRFSRKINRIQQALIQELNKMAIVHLVLRGYDKAEVSDFKLTLTNPSTQSDILKTENWQQKMNLYVDATSPGDKGIAPMSHTKAKREILQMSDDEITEDLRTQYIETIAGDEITNAITKIKSIGVFKDIQLFFNSGLIDKSSFIDDTNDKENSMGGEENLGAEEGSFPDLGAESETVGGETGGEGTGDELTNLTEEFIKDNSVKNEHYIQLLKEQIKNHKTK